MSTQLTFVSFRKLANRNNKNGLRECKKCAHCGANIGNVVTLSDGNEYGKDCAIKMQIPHIVDQIKAIEKAEKDANIRKYCVSIKSINFDGSEWYSRTDWVKCDSPDNAIAKYNKKCADYIAYLQSENRYIDTIVRNVV